MPLANPLTAPMTGFGGRPLPPPEPGADPPATEQLIAAGWGYAFLNPSSIQADNGAGLTSGIVGLTNKGQRRKPDDWGSLRAWSWGATRALDYLETDRTVDPKRAGIEGVVQSVPVQEGQQLAPGANVARVAKPGMLYAEIRIPELDARDLAPGLSAVIDTRDRLVRGRVVRVDPTVVEGTVRVEVDFEETLPSQARADLSVDGTIAIETLQNVRYVGRPVGAQSDSSTTVFRTRPGKSVAERVRQAAAMHAIGRLVSISIGEHKEVGVYVRGQAGAAKKVGLRFEEQTWPVSLSQEECKARLVAMNDDADVLGVILQRPVPSHIHGRSLASAIHPFKDLEGMNPASIGDIVYNDLALAPCTAAASVELIKAMTTIQWPAVEEAPTKVPGTSSHQPGVFQEKGTSSVRQARPTKAE